MKNIFKIGKIGESEVYNSKFDNMKNHTLLFHGSKVFNFLGILANGLKISPSEAPQTGNSLGKGIYFADDFSKSHAYCDYFEYTDNKLKQIRNKYMLICEVALGNIYEYDFNNPAVLDDSLSFLKSNQLLLIFFIIFNYEF